jgi:hypothetical protein
MQRASKEMRTWFAILAVLLWLGIWLTGFSVVHWFLYIPPLGLTFAAVSGICPSMIAVSKMMGTK